MKNFTEKERVIPIVGEYDVIVCGGGASGFVAAAASAREGATTLLVERYGILGGTATAGLMVEFGSIFDGNEVTVGGITHEFLHRLLDYGGARVRDEKTHSMTFDPESMIAVSREMVLESGVQLMLHSLVADAIAEGGTVTGVILENKSGRQGVRGRVIVDGTGDGDVAARAGAGFVKGRDADGKMQPGTLEILLGNVDSIRAAKTVNEFTPTVKEGQERGDWPIPTDRLFSWGRVAKRGAPDDPHSSFFFINGTNALDVDGTSAESLTRAEIETRRQAENLVGFLRKHAPGFENCYLDRTAVQVGIRETRRIVGDYVLSREDVLSARHFEDGVVPAHNSIDVHDVRGRDFKHEYLKPGTHYEIPYRCFLPAGIEGLLVTGRCISVDHQALGSVRVMVVCMPMGEACGTAAAIAAEKKCMPRRIPVKELKKRLRAGGTVV